MAGYVRQSTADIIPTATVRAAPINAEYNALRDAFAASGGHKHDGTSGEGEYVPLIADLDALNKVVINTTNNRVGVFVEVSAAAVEQIRIQDGVIVPVTDNDIDLGTSSVEFKDLYLDGTAYIDTLAVHESATITSNFSVNGNTTLGNAASDTVTFTADIASAMLPSADNTHDLGAVGSEWRNLYIDGTANIDALIADTATISAGTIDNTVIGGSTAVAGSFSTINSSGATTLASLTVSGATALNGGLTLDTNKFTVADTTGNTAIAGTLDVTGATTVAAFTATGTTVLPATSFGDNNITNVGNIALDSITADGSSITITGNTTFADGAYDFDVASHDGSNGLKLAGTLVTSSAAELNKLDGATVTTTEINILDGDNSATSTTVADADRVVMNDNGTMVQVAVTDLAAYFDDEITAMPNLVTTAATTVGALNSGSITSGFGSIDTGSSTITTTGNITGGNVIISDDGNIGSASDTDAIAIASNGNVTLSQNLTVSGDLQVDGTTTTVNSNNLSVDDQLIELGNGRTGSATGDSGIVIERGSDANAFIGFDESADKFTVGTGTFTGTSTGDLSITTGTLVANIEGNVTGDLTGNADTATALETARTIAGQSFDGTANISIATTDLTGVTATAAEVNIMDGDTAATSTTLADADRVVVNDAGTMKQVALTDFETYFESALDTLSNVTTVGTLNSGSITSGFGSIDNGSSAITTTGTITFGTLSDGSDSVTDIVTSVGSGSANSELPTALAVENRIQAINSISNNVSGLNATGAELNAVADVSAITIDTSTAIANNDGIAVFDSSASAIGYFDVDLLDTYFAGTTKTLTNKTLTSPTVSGLYLSDAGFIVEGSSADGNESTVTFTNPTADRTITFPDATGTVALSGATQNVDFGTVTADGLTVDNITIDGNTISTTDTNGNLIITPNGTGNVNINSDTLSVSGAEGESAALVLNADEADDNADTWRIASNTDNTLSIENQISGSSVNHVTITPNATVANSTFAVAGGILSNFTNDISKIQITTQFDTSSFLRLHPSATTNSGGFTNMFFGTSTSNNFGVSIGGVRTGSDGTPSFRIRTHSDSTTGVDVLTINNSGVSTFRSGAIFNENGDDADFRVESADNTSAIFVDADQNAVAILNGTDTNIANLSVGLTGAVVAGDTDGATIGKASIVSLNNTNNFGSTDAGVFLLSGGTNHGTAGQISSGLGFFRESNATWGTQIRFYVHESATSDIDMLQEAARFKSNEFVVNETSNDYDFRVESNNNANAFFVEGSTDHIGMGVLPTTSYGNVLQIHDTGTAGANLRLTDATSGSGTNNGMEIIQIGVESYVINREAGALSFFTNQFKRMQIESDGSVVINDISADADFRVESAADSHAIFVDAGNEDVIFGGSALDSAGTFSYRLDTDDIRHVRPATTDGDTIIAAVSGVSNGLQITDDTSNNRVYKFHNAAAQSFFLGMTEAAFNEGSNDRDFRVETNNNANMLFVDAGNDRVGIATNSPDDVLTVGGETLTYANALDGHTLGIRGGVLGGTAGDEKDIAYFAAESTNNNTLGLSLKAYRKSTGNDWTSAGFKYTLNVDNTDSVYDNLLVFQGSKIGIGTDEPAGLLHLDSDSGSGSTYGIVQNDGTANTNTIAGWVIRDGTTVMGGVRRRRDGAGSPIEVGNFASDATVDLLQNNERRITFNTSSHVIVNEPGLASDFRVESDNETHMLFVDGANDRIGIKVSSPQDDVHLDNTSGVGLMMTRTSGATSGQLGNIRFGNTNIDSNLANIGAHQEGATDAAYLSFETQATGAATAERMRILSTGDIIFGSTGSTSAPTMYFAPDSGGGAFISKKDSTNSRRAFEFNNPNGTVGSIDLSASATSYNTSSDHRLKENVVELTGATTRLKQLEPKRFNFIADADTMVDGFLAHEVQTVVPEAITGTHNEVDADGNPVYQGIDQSKLVPLLVATIQELEARITALENA